MLIWVWLTTVFQTVFHQLVGGVVVVIDDHPFMPRIFLRIHQHEVRATARGLPILLTMNCSLFNCCHGSGSRSSHDTRIIFVDTPS